MEISKAQVIQYLLLSLSTTTFPLVPSPYRQFDIVQQILMLIGELPLLANGEVYLIPEVRIEP